MSVYRTEEKVIYKGKLKITSRNRYGIKSFGLFIHVRFCFGMKNIFEVSWFFLLLIGI